MKEQFMSVWIGSNRENCKCRRVISRAQFSQTYKERWDEIARRKGFKEAFYFYCHKDQQLGVAELMQP